MAQLIQGVIKTPYYDWGGRKYIEVQLEDNSVLRVKVPFRYGRVMARIYGIRPIQDLGSGEAVQLYIERKYWDGDMHWVLHSLSVLESVHG